MSTADRSNDDADSRASGRDRGEGPSDVGERVIQGIGVAPGIAIGRASMYAQNTTAAGPSTIEAREVEREIAAFDQALKRAEQDLDSTIAVAREKLGDESVAIFRAQRMMLRDDELTGAVRRRIRDRKVGAGEALRAVMREHRERIEASSDIYLRERADDLADLQERIQRALRRGKFARSIAPDAVVVADTLGASEVVRFSQQGALGCVMDHGGATSHVSIVARALGVPTVVGLKSATESVEAGDRLIVDGQGGRLIVRPAEGTLKRYRDRQARYNSLLQSEDELSALPSETADGEAVSLQANVEFARELDLLERYGADGIGLLRTEMFFLMEQHTDLSEDEQTGAYLQAAQASAPRPATIRLFDLGGDKVLPLTSEREKNPFLGWRGVRVLLDRPELLRPQVRAVLRAGAGGPVRLLIPMVTEVGEVQTVREVIRDEADRLRERGVEHDAGVDVGAMIETPAAALRASHLAAEADFLALGTNDLTQYVLAVDRGNDLVGRGYDALHPAVLELISRSVAAADDAGIPISLCGEVASDLVATPLLLGLGLRAFSASPTYLPAVKRTVRRVAADDARRLAADVQDAPDARAVRRHVREWIADHIEDRQVNDAISRS